MKRTGTSIETRGPVCAHSDEYCVRQHPTETPHKEIQGHPWDNCDVHNILWQYSACDCLNLNLALIMYLYVHYLLFSVSNNLFATLLY